MSINFEKDLNKQQFAAVTSTAKHLRIVAGAGTGKTRVLSFHTHGHKVAKGIKSIGEWLWQLQKCNTNSNRTSETIAKWIWRSLKRI